MNIQLRPPGLSYVTQAAEGLQRRLWTVAEIEAMVVAGIIDDGERFELIDGDVVPKHARSLQHEVIRGSLVAWWMKGREARFHIACMTPFRLNASSFLEPDFVFFASKTKLADLKPSNALFAVEVADTSLRYDTGRKATLYAAHGVCELWIINAETLQTHIFTKPSADGHLERRLIESDVVLAPRFAPEIAVKMGELPLF